MTTIRNITGREFEITSDLSEHGRARVYATTMISGVEQKFVIDRAHGLVGGTATAKKFMADGATDTLRLKNDAVDGFALLDAANSADLRAFFDARDAAELSLRASAEDNRWQAAFAACPADHVPADIMWTNGDLMARGVKTRDGIETTVTDTCETHNGFVWLPVADERAAKARAASKAHRAEVSAAILMAVSVPPVAVSVYKRYHGDADVAWEAGDEQAWALINQFGPAIEEQSLAWEGDR